MHSKRQKLDGSSNARKLIIVLENCSLECGKVGKKYEILNGSSHNSILRKMKRDPSDYRPDILHQSLLMLLDSPLNRAGLLLIYFHTRDNVLVEVSPKTRLPRTYERFAGLMVQLLHKLSIRSDDEAQLLLKVIRNPISTHLPVGCRKLLTSFNAVEMVSPIRQLVPTADDDASIVIVVGCMAKGKLSVDYTEQEVKLSNYPLSAALTCAKLTSAFEEVWKIE